MNLNWKRSLLALAVSLSLASAAAAQAPRITLSKGGFNASISKGNVSVGFSHGTRNRYQAPTGYWKNVNERVWVAGHSRQVWSPDRYGWVYDNCGRKRWAVVEHGHYDQVQDPGRYEWQVRRIWVSYKTYGNGHNQRGRSRQITRRY